MKKLILVSILGVLAYASPVFVSQSKADICVPSDPDFDATDCANAGGVVGTPIGIGGGPGGGGTVPIDGGLSLMLAAGGAFGARKAWKNRKTKQNN